MQQPWLRNGKRLLGTAQHFKLHWLCHKWRVPVFHCTHVQGCTRQECSSAEPGLLSSLTRTRCVLCPSLNCRRPSTSTSTSTACMVLTDAPGCEPCRLPPCCLLLTATLRHPSTTGPWAQGWARGHLGCSLRHPTRLPHSSSSSSRRQAKASSHDCSRRARFCAGCRGQVRVWDAGVDGARGVVLLPLEAETPLVTSAYRCLFNSKSSVAAVACPSASGASMLFCGVCCGCTTGPCSWWLAAQMAWSASAAVAAAQVMMQAASLVAAAAAAGLWPGVLQSVAP